MLEPEQLQEGARARAWHALSIDETQSALGSSPAGLSSEEVARRRERYGPNAITRRKGAGPLELLWRQVNDPLIWVLLGSSVVAVVADPGDGLKNGVVILAVVVLNSLIGFAQEYKAGRAIEALAQMVPEHTTAVRGGEKVTVPVTELVPGDVVVLASGDRVPADLRLLEQRNLRTDEAALTGESVPATKSVAPVDEDVPLGDRAPLAFGGTMVTAGTAAGLVVAIGDGTELGRISTMIDEAIDLQTPLTRALAKVGKQLTVAILLVSLAMLAVGAAREVLTNDLGLLEAVRKTVIFAIALAVGAIPEGLPAIVTIALAIGVQRMASRRAVIRKLPAVETLGSTTVICTDKTGTLTRNEMTVQRLWTPRGEYAVEGVGYAPDGRVLRADGAPLDTLPDDVAALLRAGALCNDATLRVESSAPGESGGERSASITGDPTEAALVVAAEKAGMATADLHARWPRLDAIPFESEHQFMATLNQAHASPADGGGPVVFLKGAPEVVLRRCATAAGERELDREAVAATIARLAADGMRVLAVAEKRAPQGTREVSFEDVEQGFSLLGLQGMIDPPRPEAIEAVRACHQAGIVVKMITGDHKGTARAIGQQLGLVEGDAEAIGGTELARMDREALEEAAARANVFARVAPEHKLGLVRALQAREGVVAMTGDGVNDAPALKQANIGVAMGITGTSVSKEAADVVLTDDNFASIAAAVEEGRRVYDNLIKSLAFVLPTNLGLALILVCAVGFFPFEAGSSDLLLPIRATQILWLNLVGAVALALPLAFEPKEADVMQRPPRPPDAPLLGADIIVRTVIAAAVMAAASIILFLYEYQTAVAAGLSQGAAIAPAQTMAVTTVIFFQIFYMLDCRSLTAPAFWRGFFANRTVFLGIGAILLLQAAFLYVPFMQRLFDSTGLTLAQIGTAAAAGAVILPVIALEEWVRRKRRRDAAAAR